MMQFLRPTRQKLFRTTLLACVLPLAMLLRGLPKAWDLFDVSELGESVLRALLGLPIRLYYAMGGSAPRSEGFLAFPGLPEILFALACDALLFYVLACAWTARGRRRAAEPAAG